ncbi:hypothetical protein T08_15779 [Trichinella sp. T8]|nr:hypothetical protein T08_15779 [Trichinella sp. T8]
MKKTAISRFWRIESEQKMQFSIGIAACRLNPNTSINRKTSCKNMVRCVKFQ